MKPSPDLPHLRIVAIDDLLPHELADEQRAGPLAQAIKRDQILRNPPIVLPASEEEQFVVLDGANRVSALRLLEVPYMLVQVAHPNGDSVQVRTWNHILLHQDAEKIPSLFHSLNGFSFQPSDPENAAKALEERGSLATVRFRDGDTLQVATDDRSLQARIRNLAALVDAYHGNVRFERSSGAELDVLIDVYEDLAGIVIFPEFEPGQVVEGAANGWHFPPGITRFIVSPRALRVNYPLGMLAEAGSQSESQAQLDDWIRKRMRDRRVRFYAESTFLFDE